MLQAAAYTDDRGFYVEASEVEETGDGFVHRGEPVTREFGKIGKSLKNVVTPDEISDEYGADTLRLYEMFTGPLDQSRPWDSSAVVGMYRLLQRIWRIVVDEDTGTSRAADGLPLDDDTQRELHRAIAAVRDGMEALRFNTSIARITELTNHLTKAYPVGSGAPRGGRGAGADAGAARPARRRGAVVPAGPRRLPGLGSTSPRPTSSGWSTTPSRSPCRSTARCAARCGSPSDADAAALEAAARADERVATLLDGKDVRQVIAVPGRMVNFVVG